MRQKSALIMTVGLLLALPFVLVPVLAFAGPAMSNKATGIQEATLGWQLNDARVVNAGKTSVSKVGILTSDYIVEATATAIGSALIQKGTFRLTATVFSPAVDMPEQKAGLWYLQGKWTITAVNATAEEKKARYSPAVIKGDLNAELSFNPSVKGGTINAAVNLPMSPAGGRWAYGSGSFSGNEKFEGTIQMDAAIWPDVMKAKGVKP